MLPLDKINYCNLRLTISFPSSGILPAYKGSMLRGAFGLSLKKAICIHYKTRCEDCPSKDKCGYIYIFETPVSNKAFQITGSKNAPHPFILTPIDNYRRKFNAGEYLPIDLTLFGNRTIAYLPYIIRAFEIASSHGFTKKHIKAVVESVLSLSDGKKIYTPEEGLLFIPTGEKFSFKSPVLSASAVTLNFITPMRIQKEGKILSKFNFYTLMSTLLRRLYSILYFHCGIVNDIDAKAFLEKARSVTILESSLKRFEWTRLSNRQERTIDMDGMLGSITYKDVPSEYLELLKLGEIMHIGKGTTFGLGRYYIEAVQ